MWGINGFLLACKARYRVNKLCVFQSRPGDTGWTSIKFLPSDVISVLGLL